MGHIKFGAKTETNNKKRSRNEDEDQVEEQTTKKQRLTVDTSVASTSTVASSASTPTVPPTPASEKFDELDIVDELKKAIKDEYNFEKMTGIQLQSVPAALANRDADIIAQARTGSGKTIAFLLPAIDYICRNGFANGKKGIGALVLAPTRELALQIKTVAEKLLKNKHMKKYNLKLACVIGGSDKFAEAKELANASLLIATPGRCLDHLNNTEFTYKNMKYLILDEADQLLDIGFERDIKLIGIKLPKDRSTYLFSATLSTKVEDLVAVSMKKDALKIGFSDATNVNSLEQKYVQVPADKKMAALVAILKENNDKKIIVFVAVKKAVNFVSQLLTLLGMTNTALHGDMTQEKRSKTFFEFMNDKNPSILIATDVAARGLDFPCVDLIVQVDLPEQFSQYFHRVGRTARAGRKGTAMLLLTPLEISVTLARIKMYLEQSAQGKSESEEKKDELIEEYKLQTSESEVNKLHQQVVDSVASDNELYYLAPQVVNTYSGVFDMFARKLGFGRNQFDRPGLESSFGMNGGGKKGGRGGFNKGDSWGGNSGGKSWENKSYNSNNNYNNKSSFGGKKTKF